MIAIIAISTFVCISLALLGVYWLLYKPQSAATERLRNLGGTKEVGAPNIQSVVTPDDRSSEIAQRLAEPLEQTSAAIGDRSKEAAKAIDARGLSFG